MFANPFAIKTRASRDNCERATGMFHLQKFASSSQRCALEGDSMTWYPEKFSKHPVLKWLQSKRTPRRDAMFLMAVMFSLWWWVNTYRSPVELVYCSKSEGTLTPQYRCLETKALRVPRIYYGGYPLDFSKRQGEWQYLEVAYPSMEPWNSVPLYSRWNTHKLEIQLRSETTRLSREIFDVSVGLPPKASHRLKPIYGLEQYVSGEPDSRQLLLPIETVPRTFISCPYNGGNPKDDGRYGCESFSHTPWGLELFIQHKRILLPQWADIHEKVQALIESFVVNP